MHPLQLSGISFPSSPYADPVSLELQTSNCYHLSVDTSKANGFAWNVVLCLSFSECSYLRFRPYHGEIPKSFVNCSFLNVLKLDQNQLTGQILSQISNLDRSKFLNVFDNQLSGLVPVFSKTTTKFTDESFANNKELCGGPLEPFPK